MLVKPTDIYFSSVLDCSLTDHLIHRTKKWTFFKKGAFVFFAALIEKVKQLSDSSGKDGSISTLKILIVDDDEDDRLLFEEAISNIEPSIHVELAKNGMELFELMKKETTPEIIFLDLNMPGKTGKECLAEIRQHNAWKKIPVVIYSTSANRYDILDTYKGGANLYLIKPTSFSVLIRMIRKTFSFDWEQTPALSQKDFLLTHTT
jgi:CheY-like chemotaxis protein